MTFAILENFDRVLADLSDKIQGLMISNSDEIKVRLFASLQDQLTAWKNARLIPDEVEVRIEKFEFRCGILHFGAVVRGPWWWVRTQPNYDSDFFQLDLLDGGPL
jgi:hypothetical protein